MQHPTGEVWSRRCVLPGSLSGSSGSLPDVYRFLLTKQWIALGLLMVAAAATMVGLGVWQLHRYHYRDDLNTRIDAADANPPRPLAEVLTAPSSGAGSVGPAPAPEQ